MQLVARFGRQAFHSFGCLDWFLRAKLAHTPVPFGRGKPRHQASSPHALLSFAGSAKFPESVSQEPDARDAHRANFRGFLARMREHSAETSGRFSSPESSPAQGSSAEPDGGLRTERVLPVPAPLSAPPQPISEVAAVAPSAVFEFAQHALDRVAAAIAQHCSPGIVSADVGNDAIRNAWLCDTIPLLVQALDPVDGSRWSAHVTQWFLVQCSSDDLRSWLAHPSDAQAASAFVLHYQRARESARSAPLDLTPPIAPPHSPAVPLDALEPDAPPLASLATASADDFSDARPVKKHRASQKKRLVQRVNACNEPGRFTGLDSTKLNCTSAASAATTFAPGTSPGAAVLGEVTSPGHPVVADGQPSSDESESDSMSKDGHDTSWKARAARDCAYLDALPEHVRRGKCPNVPQTSAGATRNGRSKLGEQEAAVGRVAGGCAPGAALTHPSSLSPGVRALFVDNATASTGGAFGHEAMRSAIRSHKQKYEEARAALRMRHPHARA